MPCHSSEPTYREIESKRVAEFLVYLDECAGKVTPDYIIGASQSYYGGVGLLDKMTDELCSRCKAMSEQERNSIIYNPHNRTARGLADWWEDHLRYDDQKQKESELKAKKEALKVSAISKLTPEEREALNL